MDSRWSITELRSGRLGLYDCRTRGHDGYILHTSQQAETSQFYARSHGAGQGEKVETATTGRTKRKPKLRPRKRRPRPKRKPQQRPRRTLQRAKKKIATEPKRKQQKRPAACQKESTAQRRTIAERRQRNANSAPNRWRLHRSNSNLHRIPFQCTNDIDESLNAALLDSKKRLIVFAISGMRLLQNLLRHTEKTKDRTNCLPMCNASNSQSGEW